jgi:hypothetical protein
MDGRKQQELSDALLEREIEAVLAVDPSPEFLARIRSRVAAASVERAWGWTYAWVGTAAVLAIAVGASWLLRSPGLPDFETPPIVDQTRAKVDAHAPRTPAPTPVPEAPVSDAARLREAATPASEAPVDVDLAEIRLPSVVISEDEKQGLEHLISGLRGTENVAIVADGDELNVVEVAGTPWLDIAPVVIEPLPAIPPFQGEEQ